jgi:hypothetical protein
VKKYIIYSIYKMGLSNAAKTARNYSSLITQNQGGGNKKAGLPSTVGHDYWRTIYAGINYNSGSCCGLGTMQYTVNPKVCASRPISSQVQFNTYWNC